MNDLQHATNRLAEALPRNGTHEGNGRHPAAHPAGRNGSAPPGPARPPRVLILSVSAGTGHLRAAEAIELALRELRPDAHVRNIDILDLSTPPFRRCYGKMYVDFIDLAPQVLGFFYNLMDKGHAVEPGFWDRLRISLERMSMRPFVYLLTSQPWDLVISTHFLAGEIISTLRREKRIATPHVMVTTDFETHRLWVNQPCEHYFTATEEGRLHLRTFGVDPKDASAVGIPIHPSFGRPKDRAACLARQGLVGDRPILLQLSGGAGVGRIQDLYRALLDVEVPCEIVVVTAYNVQARQELEAMPVPPRHRTKILGYTRHMDELLSVADLVVSKPGGLTTSELLATGSAMVIVDPVPGQEDRNSDYLLENGAALKINHLSTMAHKLTALLREPHRLAELRTNARRLGRPRAAYEVVERSLGLIRSPVEECKVQSAECRMQNEGTPVGGPANSEPSAHSALCTLHSALGGPPPLSGLARLVRHWRASRGWFDLFEMQMMHLFARLWHRCTSSGPPPLPPTGPAIVVANHPSHADPAFLLSACARPLRFLHAREFCDVFLLRRLFARVGCIPVRRDGHDIGAVRQALRSLKEGAAICLFPEGDLSAAGPGTLPAKSGAAFLALKSGAPVYPARIDGGPRSRRLLRDWLWPSRGVRVTFGPALDLSAYRGRPITHDLLEEVTARIMQAIREVGGPSPPRSAAR